MRLYLGDSNRIRHVEMTKVLNFSRPFHLDRESNPSRQGDAKESLPLDHPVTDIALSIFEAMSSPAALDRF